MRADARAGLLAAVALLVPLAAAGCRQGMYDQAKVEPYEASALYPDGSSARPLPEGTVARGRLAADRAFHTGVREDGQVADLPMPVTAELLARGRDRYDVFCSPCHDRVGTGQGMIVRRGYTPPPSYHVDRLRDIPDGYLFDAITRGFGQMPSYASQVSPEDRWAIVAYIRALQLSQDAPLADLPEPVARVARAALAAQPAVAVPAPAAASPDRPDTAGDLPGAPVGVEITEPDEPAARELATDPSPAAPAPPPGGAP